MRPQGPGKKEPPPVPDRQQSEGDNRQAELHLLKRLLVRTSLASEGQMASLDTLLGLLREQLRSSGVDPEGLRKTQDALDRELLSLDSYKAGQAQALSAAMARLISVLRSNEPPRTRKAALKELEQLPANYDNLRDQLPGWLHELARITAEALTGQLPGAPAAVPTATSRAWFQGLFQRHRDTGPAQAEGPQSVSTNELEDSSPVRLADDSIGSERVRVQFTQRFAELLSTLGQMELPELAQGRVHALQARLAESRDWEALHEALREVGELASCAIKQSQDEFEDFLKRLDERLAALQQHFVVQSEVSGERRDESRALDETFSRNLAQLNNDARRIDDIDQLKSSVSGQVANLTDVFRDFRNNEQRRDELLSAQVGVMQEKLAAMEAHSAQMQEQLQEARGLALTDTLTQLPNRLAFDDRLAFEYDRWQRYGHPVTLVMIDIDHFKQVNDLCGHTAGDRVIQTVARTLSDNLRKTDFIARYGGEEFVMLLPETPKEKALEAVDQLRVKIGQLPFHFQKAPVRVSFSAGLAAFAEGATATAVFELADRALYQAKAGGRDQAVVAEANAV